MSSRHGKSEPTERAALSEEKQSVGVQLTALVLAGFLAPGPTPPGAQQHCQPLVP